MVQAFSLASADLFLKRWTVDDYHRMISAGILTPADRTAAHYPSKIRR